MNQKMNLCEERRADARRYSNYTKMEMDLKACDY